MAGRLRLLGRLPVDHARTALLGFLGHRLGPRARERAARVVVQAVILGPKGVALTVRSDLRGWELPGGNLGPGEEEVPGLVREVKEETGLDVVVEGLVGTWSRSGFLPHRARIYRCRPVGGELRPSRETPRVAWWDPRRPPTTLFPWYREPLAVALEERGEPVERQERLGARAIGAGFAIDLRMRWSGDEAGQARARRP